MRENIVMGDVDDGRHWSMASIKYLCLVLAMLALAACSDKPSSSEVTDQVKELLLGEPMAHVDHLKQINGYKKDSNYYVAVINYHITMLESFDQMTKEASSVKTDSKSAIASGFGLFALSLKFGGRFQKGSEFEVTDNYLFLKTDKGWILQGLDRN